jgi:iron complex outermembrane recepter protein
MNSTLRPLAAAIALPISLCSHSVTAQSDLPAVALEEIIVTATKRATSLQDTAIAVTAFSSSMMEELNVVSPFSYEKLVPSLTYQQNPNRISIRGVGRFTNALGVSPGVAIYNDGIYQAEAASLSTQPINIERSEILRGPQGTLWGRNTTGGAINIVSRRPSAELEADLRLKLGNYDLVQYAGVVSGPITDNLRYKLHALDTERDGLQKNLAGADLRSNNQTYYEAQIEWDITERLVMWAEYSEFSYNYTPGASPSEDPYDCINFWNGLGRSSQFLECQAGKENPSIGDPRKVALNTPGRVKLTNNEGIAVRFAYDMDWAELSYLYGKVAYDWDSRTDYDGTANDYSVLLDVGQYQDQQTHELQLTSNWDKRWNFIAGFYYFEDENEQPYLINAPDWPNYQTVYAPDFSQNWANPEGLIYYQRGVLDNESWAIYGEMDYEINDQWTLTLGARYSDDSYEGGETQIQYYDLAREGYPFAFDASQGSFAGDPTRYLNTLDATYNDDFTNTSGKVNLSYRPDGENLFWGTVSTGYKMGGIRLGSLEKFYAEAAGVTSDGAFDQEEVITYELGWKGQLLEQRLMTEVVAYYSDYADMQQLRGFRTPPPANIALSEVVNLDMEMYGLEVSGTYLLTDNLRAMLTYSYNHTEISEDGYFENFTYGDRDASGNIIPENVKGNQLILTPEHKAALMLHYFWPTAIGEFSLGGTYSHMGERYFDLGNHDSDGSYQSLDMQASWTSESGRYKILATATNLTDEEAYNAYSCSANGSGVHGTASFVTRCSGNPIDQRLYDIQLMLKF